MINLVSCLYRILICPMGGSLDNKKGDNMEDRIVTAYMTVYHRDIPKLDIKVNKAIEEGWQPTIAGVYINEDGKSCREMVRYKKTGRK